MELEEDVTLYCGNVSPNIKEAILYELFLQAGPIASLNMPKRDNEHRGFAFIRYRHECAVQYAVDLFEGIELDGRRLTLKKKSRKVHRPPDIYDVLGSSLEVPFGPLRNHLDIPPPHNSTGYQYQPYGNNQPKQQAQHNDFQRTPYQRYHSTDRNRSDRTNYDRNREHYDRDRHSDRRHPDNYSDRYSGRHSNHSSHRRYY